MKTPHAILIGLSLIAAAIFFKDPAVKPAHAKVVLDGYDGKTEGFDCVQRYKSKGKPDQVYCYRLDDRGVVYKFVFRRGQLNVTPKDNDWVKYE